MKAVVQRVSSASVSVQGNVIGSIKNGLLVLLGIHSNDSDEQTDWMASKVARLRIFQDDEGKMNRSVQDMKGEILVVSQFTLYGDARKGTRPSFIEAAQPEKAIPLYERFIKTLRVEHQLKVETGEFGAMMQVSLTNDGPVTLILERE
jgi:D-tyrosyl-tRNA(Tyr) deacylase